MKYYLSEDTIVALATPQGEGGIAVLRLSGPEALGITDKIFRATDGKPIVSRESHTVCHGHIADETSLVDEVLVTLMRKPRSYTGEDVVEISCHGGRMTTQLVLSLCVKKGARLAEPGEFTKRAFLNGRIDLVQAEAVLDLISAKSRLSHQAALQQLQGALSDKLHQYRDKLVELLSHLEASIDFPDEKLDTLSLSEAREILSTLCAQMRFLIDDADRGIRMKKGAAIAIVGLPNAGKSSLMNALTKTERVIVHSQPGTTRDVVEEVAEWEGLEVRLFDTAGIREAKDSVEQEGVRRAWQTIDHCQLVLWVLDGSRPFSKEEKNYLTRLESREKIIVVNKSDLELKVPQGSLNRFCAQKENPVFISCLTGEGIEELSGVIRQRILGGEAGSLLNEVLITSVRHRELLYETLTYLESAQKAVSEDFSVEFPSADVRLALDALGQMIGETVTEDILEKIFSRFCVGK